MIILTTAEILDLAEFAGLKLDESVSYDSDDLETETTIVECLAEGILDEEGVASHYRFIAYSTEYPEDGGCGLGPELPTEALPIEEKP